MIESRDRKKGNLLVKLNASPSISVIIPTFNRARTIGRAIDSALSQTVPLLEILVVDDGSLDDTVSVVRSYQDPRIKWIQLPVNQGAQSARIRGIREAKGDFLAFLDSDDQWFPDALKLRLDSFFEAGFREGLIYGDARFNGPQGEIFSYKILSGFQYPYLLRELALCPFSVMMITRRCFETVGLPSADFPSWQDDDTVLTIARKFPVHHCGSVVAVMYRAGNCISSNKTAVYEGCRRIVQKYQGDILKNNGMSWLFLWKLRVVSSRLCMVLDMLRKEDHPLKKYLLGVPLDIFHRLLKLVLRFFFSRVNS